MSLKLSVVIPTFREARNLEARTEAEAVAEKLRPLLDTGPDKRW